MKVTREQILAKAREHFASTGFRKTSLAAIASDLGVVKGALYYHIPGGKQEMADLCMQALEEELLAAMTEAVRACADPCDALRAAVNAKVGVLDALRQELSLGREVSEEIKHMVTSEKRDFHHREVKLFEEILVSGQERGAFRSLQSPRAVAKVIQAIVRHFEMSDAFAESDEDKTADLTIELILEGLKAREVSGAQAPDPTKLPKEG